MSKSINKTWRQKCTSCVSELEGTLVKDPDAFAYLMLVAFEASGLIRFATLLALWPVARLLDALGTSGFALRLTIFVATAGVPVSKLESVGRAVLPKFFFDDIDIEAWKEFNRHRKRVVVTRMPRVFVERFAKEHLLADQVVGTELVVSRFGLATGFVVGPARERVAMFFAEDDDKPCLIGSTCFLVPSCKNRCINTSPSTNTNQIDSDRPNPVIFHDGRLVRRPTPSTALLILLWIPIGILLATLRILVALLIPLWALPYFDAIFGRTVAVVHGHPPSPIKKGNGGSLGVLYVCTHRTLADPIILSYILRRRIPVLSYSVSRLAEPFSPIPTVRLTRVRHTDAERIKLELQRGDLIICPKGTTCREPYLLRFSPLFAELSDRIVPVAMNYRPGMFQATTVNGWKALDIIFYSMNPSTVYEVTFLNQLPDEATCSSGKSSRDVANHVQSLLADTLGFECTNLTRKDKYWSLARTDGTVR